MFFVFVGKKKKKREKKNTIHALLFMIVNVDSQWIFRQDRKGPLWYIYKEIVQKKHAWIFFISLLLSEILFMFLIWSKLK